MQRFPRGLYQHPDSPLRLKWLTLGPSLNRERFRSTILRRNKAEVLEGVNDVLSVILNVVQHESWGADVANVVSKAASRNRGLILPHQLAVIRVPVLVRRSSSTGDEEVGPFDSSDACRTSRRSEKSLVEKQRELKTYRLHTRYY